MRHPNFDEEKLLWERGYKFIAGLDEAGRGPLAGPVVAAAVMINPNAQIPMPNKTLNPKNKKRFGILGVRDSKLLTEKQREKIYKILIKHPDIKWGIGVVSEKVIDKINILEATKLAMKKALVGLNASFLILDGNFTLDIDLPQKSIIRGDEKVFSVAAASIIAKVKRDRIMGKMHKKYPQYGFKTNKGYPTKAHFANLEKFGPCKIHRKTFYPVSQLSTA